MTRLMLLIGLGAALMVAPMGTAAFAQSRNDSSSYKLGEVVVTAEKEIVESTGTVRKVTEEDTRNAGSRTLDEALELLPGVNVRTGADGVPRIDLRGFRSRHVLLLLDGIPFNSTYDGQFDPTLIPVESIAEIKISYGTSSVLYGDGGLGGAINIITKKGQKGLHGMVAAEAGELDHYLGKFSLSGGIDKADIFISGSSLSEQGYPLSRDFVATAAENGGMRLNSDKKRDNLFANTTFSPTPDTHIGLVFNYSKAQFGTPPGTLSNTTDPFANKQTYVRVDDSEGYAGHLSLSKDFSGPFGLRSWLFYNQLSEITRTYDNDQFNSMSNRRVKNTGNQDSKTIVIGASVQTSYDLKQAGMFTLALNARNEDYEAEGQIRDVAAGGGNFNFRNFRSDRDMSIYSVALQYEVSPITNTGLVLGYGHNWLEKHSGGRDDEGTYMTGLYYDLFKDTRLKTSFARKIRFPAIKQLYDEASGNADLVTEKSDNYEVGIEQKLPGNSKIGLTAFQEDVRNYIEKIDSTNRYENNNKYRFQGVELSAETRFLKNVLLGMGYTYLDTEDRSPDTQKHELQNQPRHKISLEGKYTFAFGFSAYLNAIYLADQVTYSTTSEKMKLNDITVVNMKFDQALLQERLNLYVGIKNLFDKDYVESYGFPQAGRFVYGGMEFRF